MGEMRSAYKVLTRKPERRSLERRSYRLEINIKMAHKEMGWEYIDWLNIGISGRLVNVLMNLQVP
jgi:hypothetical protein